MVAFKRWLIHAFMPPRQWRRAFPSVVLKAIDAAIRQSERRHRGELRFAIENTLAPSWAWHGMSARRRAIEVFSNLRVWDTEENSGVLIYVLLADREVHIVADRGIAKRVPQDEWDAVAKLMENAFRLGNFRRGALEGIELISTLLATHFPADADNPNELADKPFIVGR
jgi:uncharacterized membrane protein